MKTCYIHAIGHYNGDSILCEVQTNARETTDDLNISMFAGRIQYEFHTEAEERVAIRK
jgi:hypothetical protein